MNKNIAKIFSNMKYFLLLCITASFFNGASSTPAEQAGSIGQNAASERLKTIASFKSPIARFTADGEVQSRLNKINSSFLCTLKSNAGNKYLGDGNSGKKSVGLSETAKQLKMEIVGFTDTENTNSDKHTQFCNNMWFSFTEGTAIKYLSIESVGETKKLVFSDQKGTVTWIALKITEKNFILISKDLTTGGPLSGFVIVNSNGNLFVKHHTTAISENEKVSFQIVNQEALIAPPAVSSASTMSLDVAETPQISDQELYKSRRSVFLNIVKGTIGRINFKDKENSSAFFETDVTRILVIAAGVGVYPQNYDDLLPATDDQTYVSDEILKKLENANLCKPKSGTPEKLTGILEMDFKSNFDDSLDLATQLYNACQKPSVDQEIVRRPALAQLIGATITKIYEQIQTPLNSNGELETNPKYKKANEDPANPTSLTGIKSALFEKFKFKSTSEATNFEAYMAVINGLDNEPDDQKFNIGTDSFVFNISKIEAQIILLAACVKVGIKVDTLDPDSAELDLTKISDSDKTNSALLLLLKGTSFIKKTGTGTSATFSVSKIPSALLTMDTKLKVVQKLSSILDIEKNPEIVNAINVGRPGIGSTIRVMVSKLYADDNLRRYKDASGKAPVVELKTFVDDKFQTKIIANFYEELKEIDQQFIRAKTSEDAKKWIANLGRVFTKRLESLAKDFQPTDATLGGNDISKYIQDFSNQSLVAPLVFLRHQTENIKEIAAWKVFDSTKMPDNSKAIDKAYVLAYDLMKDLTVKEALDYVLQMFRNSGSLSEVQGKIFKNVVQVLCAKWGPAIPGETSDSTRAAQPQLTVVYANSDKIEGRLGLRFADILNMKRLVRQYEELTNTGQPIGETDLFGKCVKAIKITPTKVFQSEFVPLAFKIIHNCCLATGDSVVWDKNPEVVIKKPSLHQLNPYCSYTLPDLWDDFCENGYKKWEEAKLVNWDNPEHSEPVSAILNFVLDSIDRLSPIEKEAVASIAQKASSELTRVKGSRNVAQSALTAPISNMTITQKLQRLQSITNKILVTNQDITDFLTITEQIAKPDTFKDLDTDQNTLYGKCLRQATNSQVFKSSLENKITSATKPWTTVQADLSTRLGGTKVALIWTDPSDTTKKYTLKPIDASSVAMVNDDYLATECHFEFVTVEQTALGEIVNIKSGDKYLIVPVGAENTISLGAQPTAANAERAKFLKVKVNDTIRAFQNRFTGGFLTVRQEVKDGKTIISLATRIGSTPAGQRNADGTISPTNMSSFGFVPITKLHQDLLIQKNAYKSIENDENNVTAKNTKFLTTLAQFVQLLTDLQSTSQTSPDNLILVASIFKSFIDLCARKTTAQWKWFISSKDTDGQTFVQLATKIHDVIKTLSAGDSTVQAALTGLNKSLTDPVTQSERETALLPENNAIINISVGAGADRKYLKTYQERSTDGTDVVFVKADCTDPMDPDAQFKFVITDGKCVFYKNGTNLVITSSPATINPKWNATTRSQQERLKLLPLNTNTKAAAQQFFAIEPSNSIAEFSNIDFFITNLSEVGGTWKRNSDGYVCSMIYNSTSVAMDPIAKDPSSIDQKFKYQVTSKLVSQLDTKDPLAAVNSLLTMVQDVAGVDNKEVVLSAILNTIDKFVAKLQTDSVAWATAIGNNQLLSAFESLFALVAKTIRDQSLANLKTQFKDTISRYLGTTDPNAFGTSTISWIDPSGQKSYLKAVDSALKFSPTADSSDTSAQFAITVVQDADPSAKENPSELTITIKNGNLFVGTTEDSASKEKFLALLSSQATFKTYGPLLNVIAKASGSTANEGYFEVDPQTASIYLNDAVNKSTPIPPARASHLRVDKLSAVKVELLKVRVTDKTASQDSIRACLAVLSKMFTKTTPTLEELEATYYEFDRLLNLFLKGTGAATAKADEGYFNAFKNNNSAAVDYLFQSFDRVYKAYRATDADLYTKKLEALGKLKTKWDFGFRIEEPGVLKTGDKILLKSVANKKFVVAQDATIEKIPVFFTDANVEDAISAAQFEIVELNGRYALKYTKDNKSYVLSTKLSSLVRSNSNAIEVYKKQLTRAILVPQLKDWALETNSSLLEQFSITQDDDRKISIRAVFNQQSDGKIIENGINKGFLTTTSEEEDQGYLRANDWTNLGAPKTSIDGDSQKFEIIVLTAQTSQVFDQLSQAALKSDAAEKLAIYKSLVPLATTTETVLLVVQELKKLIKENLKIDQTTWTSFVQAFSDQIQQMAQEFEQRLPGNQILSSINLLLQQQYQDDNNGNFAIKVVFDDGKERFLKYEINATADENNKPVVETSVAATGTDKIDPFGSFVTKIEGAVESGQLISIQVKNGIDSLLNQPLRAGSQAKGDSAFLSVNAASKDLSVLPAIATSLTANQKLSFMPISGRKFMLKSGTLDLVVGENDSLSFSETQGTKRIVNLEFVPLTTTQVEFARIEGLPIETAISEFGRRVRVLTLKSKDADKQLVLERVAKFIQLLVTTKDDATKEAERKAIIQTRENDIISLINKLSEVLGDKYKDQVLKLVQAWNTQTDGPKNGDIVLIKSSLNDKYVQLMQDPQTKALYLQAASSDPVIATRFTVGRNMSTVWFAIKDASGKELLMQTSTPDLKGIDIPVVKKARTRLGFGNDQALVKFQLSSQSVNSKAHFSLKGLSTKDLMGNLSELGEKGYLTIDSNDDNYLRLFSSTASAIAKESTNPLTQLFDFVTVYGSTAQTLDQIAQLRKKPELLDQLDVLSGLVDVVTTLNDGELVASEVESIIEKAKSSGTASWQRFKDYCTESLNAIAKKYDSKFTTTKAASWTSLLSQSAKEDRPMVLGDDQEVVIISATNNKLLRVKKQSVVKNDYLFVCADADDMTQATIFKTVLLSIDDGTGNVKDYYGFVSQDDLASGQFITNVVIDKSTDLSTAKNAFTRLNFVPNTKDNFLKADDNSKYQQFVVTKSQDGAAYYLSSAYKKTTASLRPIPDVDKKCVVTVDRSNENYLRIYDANKNPLGEATDKSTQTFKILSVDKNSSDFLKGLRALAKESTIEKRIKAYVDYIQAANTVILANLLLRHLIGFVNENKKDAITWKAFVAQGSALIGQFIEAYNKTFGATPGLESTAGLESIMSAPFTQTLSSRKYAIRAIINNQPSDKWLELTQESVENIATLGLGAKGYSNLFIPTLTAKEKLLPQALFQVKVSDDNLSVAIYSDYNKGAILSGPNNTLPTGVAKFDTMALNDTILSVTAQGSVSSLPVEGSGQTFIFPVEGLRFKLKSGLNGGFYFVGQDLEAPNQLNRIQSKFPDGTLCTQELGTVFEFVELSDAEVVTIGVRAKSLVQRVREYIDTVSKIDLQSPKEAREQAVSEIENLIAQIGSDDALKKEAVNVYGQIETLITMACDPKRVSTYKAIADRTALLKDALQKALSGGLAPDTKVFLICGDSPIVPVEQAFGAGVTQTVLKAVADGDIFNDAFLMTTLSNGPLVSFILGDKTLAANALDPKTFGKFASAKKELFTTLYFVPSTEIPPKTLTTFKIIDLADGLKGFSESTTLSFVTFCPVKSQVVAGKTTLANVFGCDNMLRIFDPSKAASYTQTESSLKAENKFMLIVCDDFYNNAKALATPITSTGAARLADVNKKLQGFNDLFLQTTTDNKGHARVFYASFKKAFNGVSGFALQSALGNVNGTTGLIKKIADTWSLDDQSPVIIGMKALANASAPIGESYANDLIAMIDAGPSSGTSPDAWFTQFKTLLKQWPTLLVGANAAKSITDSRVLTFMNSKMAAESRKLQTSDLGNPAIARQVKMARFEFQSQLVQNLIKALQNLLPRGAAPAKVVLSPLNIKAVQADIKELMKGNQTILKSRVAVK